MWRFFGYMNVGGGVYGNLSSYGMYADDSTFQIVPAWQNKLQAQEFETNLYTRASHYSYEIRDNYLKIYPPPGSPNCGSTPRRMWFNFSIPQDTWVEDSDAKVGVDGINNLNTLPFSNLPYNTAKGTLLGSLNCLRSFEQKESVNLAVAVSTTRQT